MEGSYDVVIIGGGLTGLSAAETLAKGYNKAKILVIEAQGRFGGRTCSVNSSLESEIVDIGGQWVGPTQTKVLSLLDRFGIEKVEQVFSPLVKLVNGVSRPRFIEMIHINLIPLTDEEQLEVLGFEKHIEELYEKVDLESPWTCENAVELDSMSVKDYIESQIQSPAVRMELMIFCQGMVSCDPKDCSLLFFLFFILSGGGVESLGDGPDGMQKWKLQGGAQQISTFYAEEIKNLGVTFYKSSPVRRIDKDEAGDLIITYKNDDNILTVKGRRVVIAMSPALAMQKITFGEDILEADKKALYSTMLPGRAVKIILSYETEFWHIDGEDRQPVHVLDLSKFMVHNIFPSTIGKYPALIGLITGAAADRYTIMTLEDGEDAARMEVYKQLASMYGCSLEVTSNPVEIFEKNWCMEEYAYGCFAGFFPPRALTSYGPHLRSSSNGVYWACTELATEFYAYMEGGLRAGERVGHDLLSDLQSKEELNIV